MRASGNGPLCFVAMPFGIKRNHETGADCDFDQVYNQIIKPAVEKANLQCIRADEEKLGGIIHKPMYERLLLCDYAVADLSTANANVFYEVGIRHAFRPHTTVLTFAQGFRIPFDLGLVRGTPYSLDDAGMPSSPEADIAALTAALLAAQNSQTTDSPLFQLCEGLEEPNRSSLNAAAFREQAERTEQLQRRIKAANGDEELRALHNELPDKLDDVAPGALIDLLIAYRNREMYDDMIKLVEAMPDVVRTTAKVREQYALALNRNNDPDKATQVIEELQLEHGHSSDSWGILGRIYKDRWKNTVGRVGGAVAAPGWLDNAINAYTKGFETDWRDHYPGINAVQLMWLKDRGDSGWKELLPVVRYSASQAANSAKPQYWDFATLMEAAIYRDDMNEALSWLTKALTSGPKPMQAKGTLETVERLRKVLDPEQSDAQWTQIVEALRVEAAK